MNGVVRAASLVAIACVVTVVLLGGPASGVGNDRNAAYAMAADRLAGPGVRNVGQAPAMAPTSQSFSPTADTWIRDGLDDTNEGSSTFLRIRDGSNSRALVRFDQAAIQAFVNGGTVVSAKLRLTIISNGETWGSTGRPVDVHRITVEWFEGNGFRIGTSPPVVGAGSGSTWECRVDTDISNLQKDCGGSTDWVMEQPASYPFVASPTDTETIANGQTGVVEWDVTADVAPFSASYGWIVKKKDETQPGLAEFASRQHSNASARPVLVVTVEQAAQLPVAVDDSYTATGNVKINVNTAAEGVLQRNTDDTLNGATLDGFGATAGTATTTPNGSNAVTTSNGGTVVLAADGTFTYDPPAGFTGSSDTFFYRLTNTAGSDAGTVTIAVNDMIWFIDSNAPACSTNCGRLSQPFNSLGAFQAVNDGVGNHPRDNQTIFLDTGSGSYAGGVMLRQGQKLIGEGASNSITAISGIALAPHSATLPATGSTTPPTIGGTVTMATGSLVRGLNVSSGAGAGITASGAPNLTVAEVSVTSTSGTAVNFTGATTSTLSFTSVSSDGAPNGIFLSNTSGSFAVTGTGSSLNAGVRGTVAASLGTGGTIQNTTGDAIVLNGVGGNVTLRSMIVGASGATTAEGKDAVVNVTGDGIDIVNSDNIVLENVKIARTGGHGIEGTGVTGFSMRNSEIVNAGNANDEDGLNFAGGSVNNLDGAVVIDDSIISASAENNVYISNATGTLTLTVDNSLITRTANTATLANGEDGLKLETVTGGSSPSITATVTNSTFDELESDGIITAANAGTITLIAHDNTFTGVDTAFGESDNAISLSSSGTATLKYEIYANAFNSSHNSAVILNNNDSAVVHGIIRDNTFTNSTVGRGIDGALAADDNTNVRLRIHNNVMSGLRGEGMFLNANNTATLNISVTNNNVGTAGNTAIFENVTVQTASGSANSADIVAKIENNTVAAGGDGGIGGGFIAEAILLSAGSSGTQTIQLEQGSQSLATPVRDVLDANNPGAAPGTDTGLGVAVNPAPNGGGKITVVANGTVLQPVVP